jgi:uncharacterized membrane protein
MDNIRMILNNIKFDKLFKLNCTNNYKLLIKEIIHLMHNMEMVSSKEKSKQFIQTIVHKAREKKDLHNKKLNIREFLYYLYQHKIIDSYSENSILTYSDGNVYDHIFMLDAKPRFIILLFLYIGFIKDDIEPHSCVAELNSAQLEILINY